MNNNMQTPLIDLPTGVVGVGDLIELQVYFSMHKNICDYFKLVQKSYKTLLEHKVFCYEDIKKIPDYNTRKFLYQLDDNDLDELLPDFEIEETQHLQIPSFNEMANTNIGLREQIVRLRSMLDQHKKFYKPSQKDVEEAENEVNWQIEQLNRCRPAIDKKGKEYESQKKDKLAKLDRSLMNDFVCYIKKLEQIKEDIFWKVFDKKKQKIYLEEPINFYDERIKYCEEQVEYNLNICNMLRAFIEKNNKRGRLKMTNGFYKNQTQTIQSIKMIDILKDEEKLIRVTNLLKRDFPEEYEKLRNISDNHTKLLNTTFSVLVGKQLSKQALIAYKALCYIAYREYDYGNINRLSDKIEIKSSELWKLCNIKKSKDGFDTRSKQKFKNSIVKELRTDIIYDDKDEDYCTSFLLSFHDNKKGKIAFQIEDLFLVSNNSENYSYYYSDLEGGNRLMEATNNNDKAYWLHHYLEYALKSNEHKFNLTLLLEKSQLSDKYFTQRKKSEALKDLNNIMSKMVSVKTLINNYKHTPSKTDKDGQYILYNILAESRKSKKKDQCNTNAKPV